MVAEIGELQSGRFIDMQKLTKWAIYELHKLAKSMANVTKNYSLTKNH